MRLSARRRAGACWAGQDPSGEADACLGAARWDVQQPQGGTRHEKPADAPTRCLGGPSHATPPPPVAGAPTPRPRSKRPDCAPSPPPRPPGTRPRLRALLPRRRSSRRSRPGTPACVQARPSRNVSPRGSFASPSSPRSQPTPTDPGPNRAQNFGSTTEACSSSSKVPPTSPVDSRGSTRLPSAPARSCPYRGRYPHAGRMVAGPRARPRCARVHLVRPAVPTSSGRPDPARTRNGAVAQPFTRAAASGCATASGPEPTPRATAPHWPRCTVLPHFVPAQRPPAGTRCHGSSGSRSACVSKRPNRGDAAVTAAGPRGTG